MTVVIVLAKAPEPGRVKTRLTPPLSPQQAARIAAAALQDTFRAVMASERSDDAVAVFDGDSSGWVPPGVIVLPQASGGLDLRLAAAFNDVHARTRDSMVLIAMDTPQVSSAMIDDAIDALANPEIDAVFGPADDGGYWLLGLRALGSNELGYDDLFHGVPMSTAQTGAAQRARLIMNGWKVHDVAPLRDIDTIDDITNVADAYPDLCVSRIWSEISAHNAVAAADTLSEGRHS